ncbi:MAG: hypothetical protein CMK07_06670 [Ponticaulis sp.]|nr:hypothetical protein [Ponticaulis sp.]
MSVSAYPASQHDSPHARLYDRDHEHPAWRGLSPVAYKLIGYLLAKYRPNKPNSFLAGGRRMGLAINVSEKTAASAIKELIDKGHIFEERVGRNTGTRASRERVVSLSRWDSDTRKGDPERPKKVWRENK